MAGNRVISAVLTLRDANFGSTAASAANSTRDLERRVRSTSNSVRSFGKTATSNLKNVAIGAAGAVAAFVGFNAIANLGKGMVESAANAQATAAQFEQVFGDLQKSAQTTVDSLGSSFGMVSTRLKPAFTTMTSMFKGLGMNTETAMKRAESAVTLAADAAAFYDKSYEDANGALNSFIKGNYEGGESIGLFANETQLASWASKNLKVDWKKLDEAGKQVARLGFAESMQKAAGATGQAARESDSYENQLGNLRSTWDTLKAKLGAPILGPAVQGLKSLSIWVGKVDTESIINKFKKFGGAVKGAIDSSRPVLDWLKDTALPTVKSKLVEIYTAAQPGINWMKDVAFPAVGNAILFVTEKATEMYNFFKDNWPVISPIIAGVVASITAFKLGVMAVTTATAVWQGVTTAATIAAGILNGTLALTPLGWIVIGIGAVVAAGIALYQNWDKVKEVAASMGERLREVWTDIKIGFSNAWSAVKTAAGESVNFMLGKINDLIGIINKIPGVNIPIIPKVEWGEAGKVVQNASGLQNIDSFAVGTNRVARDMVANIHKDEMIIPAKQSQNLRNQGVTIDNIDHAISNRKGESKAPIVQQRTYETNNVQSGELTTLTQQMQQLIQLLKSAPKGDVKVEINGTNLSVQEIINELVPQLKLRMANI